MQAVARLEISTIMQITILLYITSNISLLKLKKVTLLTIMLYNSENNVRNTWLFCRPLFCHCSAVKCT